ncbi:TPA: hypothetical protein JBA90_08225 [Legionella pneumophila subsp. pneumophila]|nr:hypothetical protein D7226_07335 [Legionella pneumophila]HAT8945463.1 hypothetical protein [Legionella pneumophila subsp. pneumophila]RYX34286.1 hypothetical protein D7271_05955 [Legionella pneumophila]RYX45894.1 hypothetical protein D7275_00870 [Legionella pneumophila]RYX52653.1 hypothetical protein D7274_06515 [Legionella pneumophila]
MNTAKPECRNNNLFNMSYTDKDYTRTCRYPGSVQAEEMHKHRLEALTRNMKSHTRLRDGINAPSAQTVRDNN